MSDIPILEIAGGGAFALLVIDKFMEWGKTVLEQKRASKNGDNGNPLRYINGNLCNKHTGQISSNVTEITNIKEVFRESRVDNKKEHEDIKKENKKEHEEIKALIINGQK